MKTHVKVFITKNLKFRANITEPGQPPYEVTIGSESWKNGKGRQHEAIIKDKIKHVLDILIHEGGLIPDILENINKLQTVANDLRTLAGEVPSPQLAADLYSQADNIIREINTISRKIN